MVERTHMENQRRAASEALPMAHALHAPRALVEALAWADNGDNSDHARLSVVLRAVAYGGRGCRAVHHAARVPRPAECIGTPTRSFRMIRATRRRVGKQAEKAMVLLAPGLGAEEARLLDG